MPHESEINDEPKMVEIDCKVLHSIDTTGKFTLTVPSNIANADLLEEIKDYAINGNIDYEPDFSEKNGTRVTRIDVFSPDGLGATSLVNAQAVINKVSGGDPISVNEDITQLGVRVVRAMRELKESGMFSKFAVDVLKAIEESGIDVEPILLNLATQQYLDSDEYAIMHPDEPMRGNHRTCRPV